MDKKKLYIILGTFVGILLIITVSLFLFTGKEEANVLKEPDTIVEKPVDKEGTSLGGEVGNDVTGTETGENGEDTENGEETENGEGTEKGENIENSDGIENSEGAETDKGSSGNGEDKAEVNSIASEAVTKYDTEKNQTTVTNGGLTIKVNGNGKPDSSKTNINTDKNTSTEAPKNEIVSVLPEPIKDKNAPVNKDALELFNTVLDDSYEITASNGAINALKNGEPILRYDKGDKNYFFMYDITKTDEAYKIIKDLGFTLTEEEFKNIIKKSDDSDKAITEGSLYVHASSSNIQIRW